MSAKKERIEFFATLVIFGLLPVILLLVGVIPYDQRYVVMTIIVLGIIVLEKARHITWRELGFRRDTLRASLLANATLVVVLGVALLAIASTGILKSPANANFRDFYIIYVIALAPIQELLFRSIVFAEFKRAAISKPITKILLSAIIFAVPHLIYRDVTTVIVAFSIGIVWGWIYDRYPNWIGVALSHSILGTLAICIGLI